MAFSNWFLALTLFDVICFLALQKVSFCLKLLSLDVPPSVSLWDPVWLNCSLDLEGDELYSIRWYKNGDEFYRYIPRDHPPVQNFQLPGVYLNENSSVQGNVHLQNTDFSTEGMYRCEASAESPNFNTVSDEKELKVHALPDEGPVILRAQPRYQIGDMVNVTCVSGKSYPPPVLKWYVNGLEAPEEHLQREQASNESMSLGSSRLGLLFLVEPKHVEDGRLLLRCAMTVSQHYSKSTEVILNRDPDDTSTKKASNKSSGEPIISGLLEHYQVGDVLRATCTSVRSLQATDLKWFINKKQVSKNLLQPKPKEYFSDDTERSTLGLRFVVQQEHFDDASELRLKCTASESKLLSVQSTESMAETVNVSSTREIPEVVWCLMRSALVLVTSVFQLGC